MAKNCANDIAAVIFLAVISAALIVVAMFVFMILGMWALGIPIFLVGLSCVATSVSTARRTLARCAVDDARRMSN